MDSGRALDPRYRHRTFISQVFGTLCLLEQYPPASRYMVKLLTDITIFLILFTQPIDLRSKKLTAKSKNKKCVSEPINTFKKSGVKVELRKNPAHGGRYK